MNLNRSLYEIYQAIYLLAVESGSTVVPLSYACFIANDNFQQSRSIAQMIGEINLSSNLVLFAGITVIPASSAGETITNPLVTDDTIVLASIASADGTFQSLQIIQGNGEFDIIPINAPDNDTTVNYIIIRKST